MTGLHRWLAVIPAIALLGGPLVANRVRPLVLGLPFLLAWIVAWVVITSAVMALIYLLDQRAVGPRSAVRSPPSR